MAAVWSIWERWRSHGIALKVKVAVHRCHRYHRSHRRHTHKRIKIHTFGWCKYKWFAFVLLAPLPQPTANQWFSQLKCNSQIKSRERIFAVYHIQFVSLCTDCSFATGLVQQRREWYARNLSPLSEQTEQNGSHATRQMMYDLNAWHDFNHRSAPRAIWLAGFYF